MIATRVMAKSAGHAVLEIAQGKNAPLDGL
jgi:hypothetical protein